MASFKDKNGKEWTIKLDSPKIRQIREDCNGLDLVDGDGKSYDQLYDDPLLLCDVLWILVKPQADLANIQGEQFFEAVTGDAFDEALKAILKAITDFFPSQRRALLETVAAKNAKIREMGITRAIQKLDDPNLEQRAVAKLEADMDEALEKALTLPSSAKNSPAS